jgi:hypothetical protein
VRDGFADSAGGAPPTLGSLLPDLIGDAQLAARQARNPAERRAAQALMSEVYSLAQFFLAYQPDSSLLWRVAERGMVAAQESEDARAIGIAACCRRRPTATPDRRMSTLQTQ